MPELVVRSAAAGGVDALATGCESGAALLFSGMCAIIRARPRGLWSRVGRPQALRSLGSGNARTTTSCGSPLDTRRALAYLVGITLSVQRMNRGETPMATQLPVGPGDRTEDVLQAQTESGAATAGLASRGVTFRRYYTTPGLHPFDVIE